MPVLDWRWRNPKRSSDSPLTVDQFDKLVVGRIKSGDNFPAVMVDRMSANAFCCKASALLGKRIRLPTEAEWEWACRAGSDSPCYWGGGIFDSNAATRYAWHKPFGAKSVSEMKEVGLLKPNSFGVYDMSGLVKEWVDEEYMADGMSLSKDNYESSMRDPVWNKGQYAMLRNGGFNSPVNMTMSSYKVLSTPGNKSYDIGFRVVAEVL